MNQPAENALIEKIKRLPPEQIAQVEDFVEFLVTKEQRRLAGERLRAMWAGEELTPEIEQEIVAEVRAVRAERRAKREAERADRS